MGRLPCRLQRYFDAEPERLRHQRPRPDVADAGSGHQLRRRTEEVIARLIDRTPTLGSAFCWCCPGSNAERPRLRYCAERLSSYTSPEKLGGRRFQVSARRAWERPGDASLVRERACIFTENASSELKPSRTMRIAARSLLRPSARIKTDLRIRRVRERSSRTTIIDTTNKNAPSKSGRF